MRKPSELRIHGVGEFGKWMEKNMLEQHLTCAGVARILDIHPNRVRNHLKGTAYITLPDVIAYCWVFGMTDDPKDIYKLVLAD